MFIKLEDQTSFAQFSRICFVERQDLTSAAIQALAAEWRHLVACRPRASGGYAHHPAPIRTVAKRPLQTRDPYKLLAAHGFMSEEAHGEAMGSAKIHRCVVQRRISAAQA
jgi:hypothetical protein